MRKFIIAFILTIITINLYAQNKTSNPCLENKDEFIKLNKDLKNEINSCNIDNAKSIHDKISTDFANCLSLLQQDEHSDMLIQIIIAEKAIKENLGLKNSIESDLKIGNCQNAKKTLEILKTKKICISSSLKEFMDKTEIDVKDCFEEEGIRTQQKILDEYFKSYTNLGIPKLQEIEKNATTIISFLESKKIESSKLESYKNKKKELSKYLANKIVEQEKANKIRDSKYFGKILKPEIVVGTSTFMPRIVNLGEAGEIVTPIVSITKNTPSVGVVIRRYNKSKNKGFRLGVLYSQTNFAFTNPDTSTKTEALKFNYLDVQLVKTYSNSKNFHPLYLNVGLGANLPISVEYTNYLGTKIKSNTFKAIDQLGYSVFTLVGLGTGFERKNIGISLEYNVKLGGLVSSFIKNTETAVIKTDKLSTYYLNTNICLLLRVW